MKAAPLLLDLLAACPRLKLLVTSRETLRVLGDRFAEELYFWGGAPVATRRGYHVLLIDQPGQGITPFDGLYTRADAEVPVRAMVDTSHIALYGIASAGYMATRAVAFEKRISACIYRRVYKLVQRSTSRVMIALEQVCGITYDDG